MINKRLISQFCSIINIFRIIFLYFRKKKSRILIAHGDIDGNLGDILMNIELYRLIKRNFLDMEVCIAVQRYDQIDKLKKYGLQYGVKFDLVLFDCLTYTDRYHATLFSMLADVPVAAIKPYDNKLKSN